MKTSVRLFRCLPAIVGMILLTSTGQAQVTKTGGAYQFRVKYHKGMKFKYVMNLVTALPAMSAGAKPQSITMTSPIEGAVTDVQNKIATIKVTTGPTTLNGQQQGAAQTIDLKVDDRDKPVGGAPSGMENLSVELPTKPLKVGESFTNKRDITIAQMPMTVKFVYKFVGFKSVHGHSNAQFKVTTNGSGSVPTQQGATMKFTVKGTGTMGISAEDGLRTYTDLDQDVNLPQGAQTLELKTKTTVERQ